MNGIWFDDVHSWYDLNLVLAPVEIPPAIPKTNFVDIPGGNGSADLTEALGEVKFKDRDCKFTFTVFPYEDFEEKKRVISNLLNGKRCKITLDKDPHYYWIGRCSVNDYASDRNLHKIVVSAKLAPYKLRLKPTVVSVDFEKELHTNLAIINDLIVAGGDVPQYAALISYSDANCPSYQRLIPGEKYTVSFDVSADTTVIAYMGEHFFCENGVVALTPGTRNSFTATFKGDVTDVKLLKAANAGYIGISNVKVERGTVATGYTMAPEDDVSITPISSMIALCNGRKSVCPTIQCAGETTFTTDDGEFTLGIGTHKNLNFQLTMGKKNVKVTGCHNVTFTYQEGDL